MSHRSLVFYFLIFFLAVPATMLIHEGGHFLAGESLGNQMEMDLNNTRPVLGFYQKPWHSPVVAASGSLFSLLQVFLIWFLLKKSRFFFLYPFLFYPVFYRAIPYLLTIGDPEIRMLQDKGQVGAFLGINPFVLIIPYLFLTVYLVFSSSKRLKIKWQVNLLSLIFSFLFTLLWLQINHLLFV